MSTELADQLVTCGMSYIFAASDPPEALMVPVEETTTEDTNVVPVGASSGTLVAT